MVLNSIMEYVDVIFYYFDMQQLGSSLQTVINLKIYYFLLLDVQ